MDEVAAAVTMRDFVLIITKNGTVYKIRYDELSHQLNVYRELQLKMPLT